VTGQGGYQPGTVSPSSRRADFDLRRRLDEVFVGPSAPTNGNHELWFNTQTGVLSVWWSDEWVALSVGTPGPEGPAGPPGPQGPPGSGGGTGTDEVWIGPDDPIATNPTIELWVDSDEDGSSGGGPSGPVSYVHHQDIAAATWTIVHDLNWYPNVTVVASSGDVVEGDVAYTTSNTVALTFSGAFAGVAYLS